jgi:hypothetical protein
MRAVNLKSRQEFLQLLKEIDAAHQSLRAVASVSRFDSLSGRSGINWSDYWFSDLPDSFLAYRDKYVLTRTDTTYYEGGGISVIYQGIVDLVDYPSTTMTLRVTKEPNGTIRFSTGVSAFNLQGLVLDYGQSMPFSLSGPERLSIGAGGQVGTGTYMITVPNGADWTLTVIGDVPASSGIPTPAPMPTPLPRPSSPWCDYICPPALPPTTPVVPSPTPFPSTYYIEKVLATGTSRSSFTWDGKVDGIVLPPGTYNLVLKCLGESTSKQVTVSPLGDFSVDIDGATVFDGQDNIATVVDRINPIIRIHALDDPSNTFRPDNVKLEFSPRADGVTPEVDPEFEYFDASSKTIVYAVPPDVDDLLYMGDQSIKVTWKGKTRTINFSVGTKTLYSGIPGLDSSGLAYRVMQSAPAGPPSVTRVPRGEPVRPWLPAPYSDATKYVVQEVDLDTLFKKASAMEPQRYLPPSSKCYVAFERAAFVGFKAALQTGKYLLAPTPIGVTFIVLDLASNSAIEFTNNITNVTVSSPAGNISTTSNTWDNIARFEERTHSGRLTKATVVEALNKFKEIQKDNFEYWTEKKDDPSTGYLITKVNNNLVTLQIKPVGGKLVTEVVEIPGLLWLADMALGHSLWPEGLIDPWKIGWSDIAHHVMRFRPDYDTPFRERKIWGQNWVPTYRWYFKGTNDKFAGWIKDGRKPYQRDSGFSSLHSDYALPAYKGYFAVHNGFEDIACLAPDFAPGEVEAHAGRIDHFPELSDQNYVAKAQSQLYKGAKEYYRRTQTAKGGAPGDVVTWDPSGNCLVVWSDRGRIRTMHQLRPTGEYASSPMRMWQRLKGNEGANPY